MRSQRKGWGVQSAEALATLEELGASQWGLVTTGQAETYGVSRVDLGRLRGNGLVRRVRRGVYSLPSAGHGPVQDLHAAWLSLDPRTTAEQRVEQEPVTLVSHASAAAVHSLGDLVPSVHEFTSARRRQTTHQDIRFHRRELSVEDHALVDGLPVTSVLRTLEDLASAGIDMDHLAEAVRDALAKPDVHPGALASRLDQRAGHYGHDSGQALVDDCLDRAGLPTVAANLAGSRAFAAAFMSQLSSADRSQLFGVVARQSISAEFKAAINQIVGAIISEQMRQFTAPHLPVTQDFRDQLAVTVQKGLAPMVEAQVARAAREAFPRNASELSREVPDRHGDELGEDAERMDQEGPADDGGAQA